MAKKSRDFNAEEIVSVMDEALVVAKNLEHEYVTTEHLLFAMLNSDDVITTLTELEVDVDVVRSYLTDAFESGVIPKGMPGIDPVDTETLLSLVQITIAQVMFSSRIKASSRDLLLSILQLNNSLAAQALKHQGLTELKLKVHLSHGKPSANPNGPPMITGPDGEQRIKDIANKEEALAFLAKFTSNLNEVAEQGNIDSVIGRESEIDEITQITVRRNKRNVVLVGEPGVGKTAIVDGLALKIVRKEVPEIIQNCTVFSLSVGDLVAGTRYRGDVEERMKFILKALNFIDEPILFIDEIHMIMGAGSGKDGAMDVANLLKPALAKGKIRCIGSTTFDEYQKHFEKDRALVRRFEKLDILEPDVASAKLIMRGLRTHYEKHHGVTYTDESLDAAVDLTHRFVQNKFLPDKAIDVIDRAGARQKVRNEDARVLVLGSTEIEFEVSKIAKIPAKTVSSSEREKLLTLTANLTKHVYGQPNAVETVVSAVMMARSGLRENNKTAGSYLFVGPSGVGKTQLAKTLADTLNVPLVRFDMSEYAEQHTVAKLIGAPPGYVGHGEGGAGSGLLTTKVEQTPHCVLLLDEIEKAHPLVLNTFLQVMDAGKLTNSNGKSAYFDNVTVIFTSNLGAREQAAGVLGFTMQNRDSDGDKVINTFLSPEFRNRLDAIVKFNKLGKDLRLVVVNKFVNQMSAKVSDRGMALNISEEALNWLADKEVDENLGARPIERVVNEYVMKPLSRVLVLDEPAKGSTIKVDVVENKIAITVASN